jgi:hypothetical protein
MTTVGSVKAGPKTKSVSINSNGKTSYSRSSKSRNEVDDKPKPVSDLTLLGLGIILFVVLVLPTNGDGMICFIPLMILFALKDILKIPTKLFIGLLAIMGILLAYWFINAMAGMGMY